MSARQRGVALISVLLVMSLALLITAGMLRSHRLIVHSSAQQLHHVQLRQLGLAGEGWALQSLGRLAQEEQQTVHLAQAWARATPGFAQEHGEIRVGIEDLAGRFNLNSLFRGGQVDQLTLERWARLLEHLKLPPVDAHALRAAAPGGLSDVSQLRVLPGIDARVLQQLQPWVAVLPPDASLNINTAPLPVLMTLDGMTLATARQLVMQRPEQGYPSAQAFTQQPLLSGLGVGSHGLGVDSRWFRITVEVALGQRQLRWVADVERDLDSHRLNILQRRLLAPISEPIL
ncbi:type II secretion system protein GspK [Pseudomonas sp. GD03860]|uniref:type II secretion system protein GspK n=1 Tax=Pseudomonas TaxID=286 RepID=UPI0023644D4B|nr:MULTISPECIES: type II secretion system protein GspK [Pseudomonas]MDD2058606.1 type II secretion system protein GspK [Pseudomonas putida]MDH0640795.1 type II secretion system protein GspK [Pseudomonas sp. GD03860]